MDKQLNYYCVNYTVLNKGKFYTLGERIVLGLSEQHARENFIPELLQGLQRKQEYRYNCGLLSELEVRIKSVKKFNGLVLGSLKREFSN